MTTYNGWTNYATWRVNLEIFDGLSIRDILSGISDDLSCYDAAAALKDTAETLICDQAPEGLARDYALAFISDVNWREIAAHMLEGVE
jgi:hypothetical protein